MGRGVAVITFPGSNGDRDAYAAFDDSLGVPTTLVDYRATDLDGFDAVVLPGGFSYGDYLRSGAIARFAPVVNSLRAFADAGGPVLGICNGFQILTEARLLPGALLRNQSLQFRSEWIAIGVESSESAWTQSLERGDILNLPIAHGDGSYFADDATLDTLEGNGQVMFRYCDALDQADTSVNFNGSRNAIAGICNEGRNVVGLMPHPERATDPLLGPTDGLRILSNVMSFLNVTA